MDFALVLKETEGDAVHWRVAPSLIEEAARTIEVLEVVLIRLRAPEVHVADLKIAPEMAGGKALSAGIVTRSPFIVLDPFLRAVVMDVLWMFGQELLRLRPDRRHCLWKIVQIDGEAVCFVVVVHVPKNVVIHIAEEMYVWLDSPIVANIFQRRMSVEKSRVPTTHLMVRHLRSVLDLVLL